MPDSNRMDFKPSRPSLPLAFVSACAFWVACAVAYASGQTATCHDCLVLSTALLASCIVATPLASRLGTPLAAVFIASLVVGAAYGFAASYDLHVTSSSISDGAIERATITLSDDTKLTGMGERAFCRVVTAEGTEFTALVTFEDCHARYCGQTVRADVSLKKADWEDDSYLWQNGAIAKGYAKACTPLQENRIEDLVLSFRENAIRSFDDGTEDGAFLQAIVCGYRHDVSSTALYASFQKCGLAHLIAVSGAHLAIVAALVASFLKTLGAPRRVVIVVSIIAMGSYLLLAGAPVSGMRAAVMATLAMSSHFAKRRPSSANALGVGIFAIVVATPSASVSPSFVLSALSTTGIVMFAPLFRFWIDRAFLSRFPLVCDALSLTLSACFLSMPYACSLFNQLPLASPIANVICGPLFTPICLLGLLCGIFLTIEAPFASALAFACTKTVNALSFIVGVLSSLPFASIPIDLDMTIALASSMTAAFSVWLAWPVKPTKHLARALGCVALALVISFSLFVSNAQKDCIVMLDIGQGDAILVKSRGRALLVDTGNLDNQLLGQLAASSTFSLDAVLVTHNDDDHCGSLDALERSTQVGTVLMFSGLLESDNEKNRKLVEQASRAGDAVLGLDVGDCIRVGAFSAYVIWPDRLVDEGGNADSLCLLVEYDGNDDGEPEFTALLTGDAECEVLQDLIDDKRVSHVDVLKVGHHGSKNAFTQEQLESLDPRIALIGVGADNRYGHPASEVVQMLDDIGCKVYRTDIDGQVTCYFSRECIGIALQ